VGARRFDGVLRLGESATGYLGRSEPGPHASLPVEARPGQSRRQPALAASSRFRRHCPLRFESNIRYPSDGGAIMAVFGE
jgi:hypothetical protein